MRLPTTLCAAASLVLISCGPVVIVGPPKTPADKPTINVPLDGSITIRANCDRDGRCTDASAGAGKPAALTCTEATGNNPWTYIPACYFFCVPSCGTARLKQGETGNTSTAGTITLHCNGQAPMECALKIDTP
jgi:hypothetical protein